MCVASAIIMWTCPPSDDSRCLFLATEIHAERPILFFSPFG